MGGVKSALNLNMSCKAKSCKYWKKCGVKTACDDFRCADYEPNTTNEVRRQTPYERTKAAVYATGNKWAIENFNATH